MLYVGNKEITQVFKGSKNIIAIFKGNKLVWEAVNSCFGKGFWINEKPWSNDDGWKN